MEVAGQAIRALSSPTRLRILCLLFEGERSVAELTRLVKGHTQSSISQHLAFLLKSDIVTNRKHKTQMLYRINDQRVHLLLRLIAEVFCHGQSRGPAGHQAADGVCPSPLTH
jgi:ArsR family transcriptional regulator, virulence genes transcriptional regulator